jgi:subtilase family serine protease
VRHSASLFFMFAAANIGMLTIPAVAAPSRAPLAVPGTALAASVPDLSGVRDLGRAPQSLPISLAVTLTYRHDAELQQLIDLQSNPSSRYYHQYLSNDQFAAYFAPTEATQQSVIASFERAGFVVATTFPNRTVVDVVAPAAVAERYFQTQFHRVLQPNVGARYANVTPAVMPAELRGTVTAITGLTNVIYTHTANEIATPIEAAAVKARSLDVFGSNAQSLVGTRIPGFRAPAESDVAPLATTGNELRDPGFESGKYGSWQPCFALSAADPEFTKAEKHTGSYSSFAGSLTSKSGEIDGAAGMCETLTIPTNGTLSFWVYQYSNEPNTSQAFQEADLLDRTGKRIANFYATVNTTKGWKQLTYNVSKYAGGRYFLYFGVDANGNKTHETYQYVDDVSLSGSAYPVTGTKLGSPLAGPNGGYGPAVVADAYDFPVQHGYDGAGRATGVEISGDYSDADLYDYLDYYGITRGGSTTRVEVDGGAKFSGSNPPNASSEATLDVETIVGLAPSTQLYMYLFPELSQKYIEDGYNKAVSDNIVDVVNSSFGGCESTQAAYAEAIEKIVEQGAAKGITFAASSGDSGSKACSPKGVESPASSPHVVAVGGTSLYVTGSAGYRSEAGWSGSGGGVSTVFAKPSYQNGINGVIGSTRNVPDVAYPADPNTGHDYLFAGHWSITGGTSWASPVFCALQTEIDQRLKKRMGFVNPDLYAAALKYGTNAFHDITSGSNGAYSAHAGYDNVTGIGSIKAYYFSGVE